MPKACCEVIMFNFIRAARSNENRFGNAFPSDLITFWEAFSNKICISEAEALLGCSSVVLAAWRGSWKKGIREV